MTIVCLRRKIQILYGVAFVDELVKMRSMERLLFLFLGLIILVVGLYFCAHYGASIWLQQHSGGVDAYVSQRSWVLLGFNGVVCLLGGAVLVLGFRKPKSRRKMM